MPRGAPTRLLTIRIPEEIAEEAEKRAKEAGSTLREEVQRVLIEALPEEARMARMSIRVVRANDIPAAARKRIGLAENSTAPVEVYQYHRSESEIAVREEQARQLEAAYDREEAERGRR